MHRASPARRGGSDSAWGSLRRLIVLSTGAAFAGVLILAALVLKDRIIDPPARFAWSIRAAGVTKLERAIPRLRELSAWSNLDSALAAKRSLADLEGPEVNAVPDEARAALHGFEERFPLARRGR